MKDAEKVIAILTDALRRIDELDPLGPSAELARRALEDAEAVVASVRSS